MSKKQVIIKYHMEKKWRVLFILIFSLISCSKNENSESDPDPVVKRLTQMSYEASTKDESIIQTNKFFYSGNKLTSVVTEYIDRDESEIREGTLANWELIYNTNNRITLNSTFSERYEEEEEETVNKAEYIFVLNDEGLVISSKMRYIDYNGNEIENEFLRFKYTNGYLTSIEDDFYYYADDLNCEISYLDGSISRISDKSKTSDDNLGIINCIPSDIKNSTNLCDPILPFIWDVIVSGSDNGFMTVVLPLEIIYQAGLLGKPTANLTKSFTISSGNGIKKGVFNYVLENNYLKEAILSSEDNSDEFIKWSYSFE